MKSAPQAGEGGERLFIPPGMVTHAVAWVPKTAKCPCVGKKVICRKSRRSVADAGTSSAIGFDAAISQLFRGRH